MSMSDNVDSSGAKNKQPNAPGNTFGAAAPGQAPGQPAGGLPGLAGFGGMQAYTPQQEGDAAAAPAEQPAAQEPAAAPEEAYQAQAPVEPQPAPAAEPVQAQPEPTYEQPPLPEAPPPAAPAEPTVAESASAHVADLQEAYGAQPTAAEPAPAAEAEYQFTPEELQNYMAQQEAAEAQAAASFEQAAAPAAAAPQPEAAQPAPEENADPFELSSNMALQTFEARYDQHAEVPLGSFDEPGDQAYFEKSAQSDADFLGEEAAGDEMAPPKERKSRKKLMFAAGLIGALALGGALAFAYKTGGSPKLASGDAPPLIKADDKPVKVSVAEPGGKQFPHQNKKIYDRLQGDQKPEVERIVPRQEQVASTAPATTGLDSDRPMPGAPQQVAVAAPAAPAAGGPNKVRTLQVRPDGSVVVTAPPPAPQPVAAPAVPPLPTAGAGGIAVSAPAAPVAAQPVQAVAADPTTVASVPQQPAPPPAAPPAPAAAAQPAAPAVAVAPAPLPDPKPKAPTRTAAAAAAPQAAGDGSIFVVQVASRRSQAMALAAFADLQQKYTSLLGNYQPMIQSADLGNKGTWYRLRVGPIGKKADADSLCRKLKRAGLRSCLVRPL